ncbi:MAG: HU family DNA-binding protein [Nitrospira sp.]|nr:HU family DNA-binding protein [Nitrospira sp.]
MAKAMTRSEIVNHLSQKTGLTKKVTSQFLNDLASLAYREVKNSFEIPGIGKLVLSSRKARIGRSASTGKFVGVATQKVVKFRASKKIKEKLSEGTGSGGPRIVR